MHVGYNKDLDQWDWDIRRSPEDLDDVRISHSMTEDKQVHC